MVNIPTIFAEGDVPTAAQINGNFAAVGARSFRNADIAANAGIDRSKLGQRFVPGNIFISAIDYTADSDLGLDGTLVDPTPFDGLASSFVTLKQFYFRKPAGTSMWLATIDVHVMEATNSPQVRFAVDAIVFDPITVSTGVRYTLGNASTPFLAPLAPVSDGSLFQIAVQGGGSATIRGLDVSLATKMELSE